MRDTHSNLNLQLFKGRKADRCFQEDKAERKEKSENDSDEEREHYLTYVNILLRSLFF